MAGYIVTSDHTPRLVDGRVSLSVQLQDDTGASAPAQQVWIHVGGATGLELVRMVRAELERMALRYAEIASRKKEASVPSLIGLAGTVDGGRSPPATIG